MPQQQVRKEQNWSEDQPMRFISSGQELFLEDSVSKALGSVLHCIQSICPAQKFSPKTGVGHGHKGVQHSSAVDWVSGKAPCTAASTCNSCSCLSGRA
jgi:hypothetical protein